VPAFLLAPQEERIELPGGHPPGLAHLDRFNLAAVNEPVDLGPRKRQQGTGFFDGVRHLFVV